ncbi:MAG: sodium:solute symporter family protein [Chitinophagales bacterium]
MNLTGLDWIFIGGFFVVSLVIGLMVTKQAGKDSKEFFLSGRNMPWWLLGISMVATTFSADTPNLVTDIVRKNGIAGNWVWWAFLLTGMLTVFVYAKLWRRSGVMTDLEFYELRYSGKMAAFLRGFRAIYLGVFFNVLIMASVCLAAIKIGGVLLGLTPLQTLLIASIVTVIYSALGGLRGVIITDFVQFGMAMIGAVWAAYVVVNLPQINGLTNLLNHPNLAGKLNLMPDFNNMNVLLPLFIIPLAVQWWSVWYPGAEPGGGGYIAQRMLAAKDEKNAMGATLLFNISHYALRPWPWILIALASLVVFPMSLTNNYDQVPVADNAAQFLAERTIAADIDILVEAIDYKSAESKDASLQGQYQTLRNIVDGNRTDPQIMSLAYIFKERNRGKTDKNTWTNPLEDQQVVYLQLANPKIEVSKLGNDLAYSAMLPFLPSGLLGLVVASLIAAFMSTISTHLNWGSSDVVNDFYKRFYKPEATEKEMVFVGRASTVVLMILAALLALALSNALQAFNILLQIGAGTGLIYILRWFWWRINAYSEVTAMVVSFIVALFFHIVDLGLLDYQKLIAGIVVTTVAWVAATFLTAPTDKEKLISFYKLIKPAKAGWAPVVNEALAAGTLKESEVKAGQLPLEIGGMVIGCFTVYATLFGTGYWIYGETTSAIISTVVAVVGAFLLFKIWGKVNS